jgi:hypothetical protein
VTLIDVDAEAADAHARRLQGEGSTCGPPSPT